MIFLPDFFAIIIIFLIDILWNFVKAVYGGARCMTVIVVGSGLSYPSLDPEQGSLLFT